jgi:hypothetical protein
MRQFIVTMKKYQEGHNPRDKKTGVCQTSTMCTDSTGHHHSFLCEACCMECIKLEYPEIHITRIEAIEYIPEVDHKCS